MAEALTSGWKITDLFITMECLVIQILRVIKCIKSQGGRMDALSSWVSCLSGHLYTGIKQSAIQITYDTTASLNS